MMLISEAWNICQHDQCSKNYGSPTCEIRLKVTWRAWIEYYEKSFIPLCRELSHDVLFMKYKASMFLFRPSDVVFQKHFKGLRRNCVALPHCTLLHRNCDVIALQCRMKVKLIFTWNAVKLRWLAAGRKQSIYRHRNAIAA